VGKLKIGGDAMAFTEYTKDTTIIGALGTNPAERALTTQEFKDKFDQFATEFVEWFNETHLPEAAEKAVVDEHKAEKASHDVHSLLSNGKIIQESGTNANGQYIRFADGTQICSIHEIVTTAITTASGSYFKDDNGNRVWSYPATFLTNTPPAISGTASDIEVNAAYGWICLDSWSELLARFSLFSDTALTSRPVRYSLIAIGRWK
jgi:hypothetical protein